MTVVEKLAEMGFEAEVVNQRGGKVAVKIKTAKGWSYEWFTSASAVDEAGTVGNRLEPAQ